MPRSQNTLNLPMTSAAIPETFLLSLMLFRDKHTPKQTVSLINTETLAVSHSATNMQIHNNLDSTGKVSLNYRKDRFLFVFTLITKHQKASNNLDQSGYLLRKMQHRCTQQKVIIVFQKVFYLFQINCASDIFFSIPANILVQFHNFTHPASVRYVSLEFQT